MFTTQSNCVCLLFVVMAIKTQYAKRVFKSEYLSIWVLTVSSIMSIDHDNILLPTYFVGDSVRLQHEHQSNFQKLLAGIISN